MDRSSSLLRSSASNEAAARASKKRGVLLAIRNLSRPRCFNTAISSRAMDEIGTFISAQQACEEIVHKRTSGSSKWAKFATYATENEEKQFFVKVSEKQPGEMFVGEKIGLDALLKAGGPSMRIPKVFYAGRTPEGYVGANSMIIMEHLRFGKRGDQGEFGLALAKMHAADTASEQFGFSVNNTIGETLQINVARTSDWEQFWVESRLLPQLKLSRDNELQRLGDEVIEKRVSEMFKGLLIKPSLLHGDLWSGNIATVDGQPTIFDPAVYYGHHEAEFGMSWCAGFSPAFHEAYWSIIPKDKSGAYEERKIMYQLYHILNHYNMFGGGYREQAIGMLKQLL